MPQIAYNGQIFEITQAQYDAYTIGQALPTGAVLATPANVAGGGTVTVNDSTTSTILTQNTTNNTPGQTLTEEQARLQFSATFDPPPGLTPQGYEIAQEQAFQAYFQPLVAQQNAGITATLTGTAVTPNAQGTGIPVASTLSAGETIVDASSVNTSAEATTSTDYYASADAVTVVSGNGEGAAANSTSAESAGVIQGLTSNAQSQQTFAIQRRQVNNADWRVRLRLAPESKYLYNAEQPGILQPLKVTDGIVFPYTPSINTSYRANYNSYDLTHSNYRGYFYTNSYTDAVQLNGMFTAQDTNEANYLLAVIHFLRSATKMFYGQDAERGSPPPVVYLSGLGEYQFKEHACLIQQFTYNLPADCDYIRAGSPNQVGLNLVGIRDRQDVATNSIFGQLNRLAAAFLTKGGVTEPPAPPTLGKNSPAYVPTKMEIQITLLPVQSRNQVSKQFSLKGFANGDLIKGGFW